jgi:hypothetical protein
MPLDEEPVALSSFLTATFAAKRKPSMLAYATPIDESMPAQKGCVSPGLSGRSRSPKSPC